MIYEIALVGTSHSYQFPTNTDAEAFKSLIVCILDSLDFAAIAEEMSEEALSEHGAPSSLGKQIADERGIRHRYCDPDRQTRNELGISQENCIRAAAIHWNLSEDEVGERILDSRDRRELYWLDRVLELDCWPVLFICGANHVDSFAAKINGRGLTAKVLASDWSPIGTE
jgi:hypothetical protein